MYFIQYTLRNLILHTIHNMSAKIIKGNFGNTNIKAGEKYNCEYLLLGYYAGTLASIEQGKTLGIFPLKNNSMTKPIAKLVEDTRKDLNIPYVKTSIDKLLPHQDVIENHENKMHYMCGGTASLYYGFLSLYVGFMNSLMENTTPIPKEDIDFLNLQKKTLMTSIESMKIDYLQITKEIDLAMFDTHIPILKKTGKIYFIHGSIDNYMLDLLVPYLEQKINKE